MYCPRRLEQCLESTCFRRRKRTIKSSCEKRNCDLVIMEPHNCKLKDCLRKTRHQWKRKLSNNGTVKHDMFDCTLLP